MHLKYKYKIFTNLILLVLICQLNHITKIYEMARVSFDIPMIEHIKRTPLETKVKALYKQLPQKKESHRAENLYFSGAVTAALVYHDGIYY